ncbi:MAG: GHMP kinase [Acidobacteria bacterium]|nr:GHMP kinase [Acidobacteriota bacterium]MBI3658029.1 GHMP kinase [Acidobacteriota bacterium]
MKLIKEKAYARAGLLGNPSDGYNGKTISLIVKNFRAEVVLYEWPELEIILTRQDRCLFSNMAGLVEDVRLHGYYGGLRLIKAAIKKFAEYCDRHNIRLADQNFSIRYDSDIPRQVGLAGSSALITATMRALMRFYDVSIAKEILPGLILAVEVEEIGIAAGLQDRVIQVYEGVVYMDFAEPLLRAHGHGHYEPLDASCLPPLYIAYRTDLSESSDVFHNNIRQRFLQGDPAVISALHEIAELAGQGRACLLSRDYSTLGELMNKNFDARRRIYNLSPRNIRMVELARSLGASAKFAGSGGAVIGIYRDETMYERLRQAFKEEQCEILKPITV